MLIISGFLTVDPKHRDAYVSAFADMTRRARETTGCLGFALTADVVDGNRINLFEQWEDEDALAGWRKISKPPDTGIEIVSANVRKHTIQKSEDPF